MNRRIHHALLVFAKAEFLYLLQQKGNSIEFQLRLRCLATYLKQRNV